MLTEKDERLLFNKFNVSYLYPFGIELHGISLDTQIQDLTPPFLRNLIAKHKIIVIRGAPTISEHRLVEYAKEIGPLLAWDFGLVMEMRAHKKPKNYLFTSGSVPFHWDGAFHQEPRYLLFHCIEAPLPNCGGETFFADTHRIWNQANDLEKQDWIHKKIKYKTEKLAHYGGEIEIPLVQKHPDTGEIILRFAEPVPSNLLNPVEVNVSGMNELEAAEWLDSMAGRFYQKENCYEHQWKNNDFLLADNFSLIHGRHAFKNFSPRFLRRIQIL